MTVLVLAPERDITADRMIGVLRARAVPVARVDTGWFPQRATLDAELRGGRWVGTLDAGGRTVELEGMRSVWWRHPSAFRFTPELSATERHWAMTEAKLGLGGVLTSLPVLWINHPNRNADAAYKPRQLVVAARVGLAVPDTLITNRPEAVRKFADEGETVAKALGAAAIVEDSGRKTAFTHRLDVADLTDLRGVEHTAHQFQRWVPKAFEARVIVVGERVFAAAIHAGSAESHVYWRRDYRALCYEPIEPPTRVAACVLAYCAEFGLTYGAFDFVVRPDEEWVFLEFTDRRSASTPRSWRDVTDPFHDRLPAMFGTFVLFSGRDGACGADGVGRGSAGPGDRARRGLAVLDGAVARGCDVCGSGPVPAAA